MFCECGNEIVRRKGQRGPLASRCEECRSAPSNARAERLAKLPPESEYEGYPKKLEARRMYVAGFNHSEIGEHFGIGRSTAAQWITDPQLKGVRARKDRLYSGPCADCGKTLQRSGPNESKRCGECHELWLHNNKYWTRGRIIAVIWEFADRYGHPPSVSDFRASPNELKRLPEQTAASILARKRDMKMPALGSIVAEFGTWNAAIEAAGFEPTVGRRGKSWRTAA